MTPTESRRNPVEVLADEFLARYRRGERPALTEYTGKYPELADEIRDLFPALVMMEEAGRRDASLPGAGHRMPDRVGDYRILREVGRGGMGIVYEAEHEALGRHVALKLLPPQAMLDSRHLARFQREARAAARLHHTNIVPVFGVGEQDGFHFYVMQFIQGLGLDEVLLELHRQRRQCPSGQSAGANEGANRVAREARNRAILDDQSDSPDRTSRTGAAELSIALAAQHLMTGVFDRVADGARDVITLAESARPPAAPSSNSYSSSSAADSSAAQPTGLSATVTTLDAGNSYWQSVARIGVQVAEALDYASAQGVLHRDIKPSNLLLDMRGTVWITDFGLAKASDSDDLTGTGDIVGTLRYLAPERLHGRSDVLGDIYSLGVTLYELLTLRPAFEDSDRLKLFGALEREEPARPRIIDPTIPRDLETIVLKAIAKDPAERYQSPADMANDLKQFLEDRPIRARRATVTEHVWRWCRRNRTVAGLLVSVAILLSALSLGAGFMNLLRVDRNRAKDAEAKARGLLGRAELAERENKIRSHLAQATALRRTGQAGQRFGCLDQITQAMRLGPSKELRGQLRNEAIAALSMTDLKVRWSRPVTSSTGLSLDPQFESYAVTDTSTWETLVRRLADDQEVLHVPAPDGPVWYAATEFSSDGQLLALVYFLSGRGYEALLDVWRIDIGERIHQAIIRSGMVAGAIAFHPTSPWLLYCTPSGELCTWDLAQNRPVRQVPLKLTPYSICLDSRSERVAANDIFSGEIEILDLETGHELAAWPDQPGGYAMAWSADDRLLAVATVQGRVSVWNVERGELVSVLDGHTRAVTRAQFAQRGHLLATTSWDGTTRLWDAVSGESLVQAPGSLLRFSQDDGQVAFYDDGNIGVWDLAAGRERRTLHPNIVGNRTEDRLRGDLYRVEFLGDGRLLATSTSDGIHLWDGDTIDPLGFLDIGSSRRALLNPSGDYLLTVGVAGVLRWPIRRDNSRDQDEWHIGPPQVLYELAPDNKNMYDFAWFPDHQRVAVNNVQHGEVVILRVENSGLPEAPVRLASRFGNTITGIDVSPDGKWIAAGGWKSNGVQVWNVVTGEIECVLPPRFEEIGNPSIFRIAFSPDNRWLVCQTSNDNTGGVGYYFWEVGSWMKSHFLPASRTSSVGVAFAPDSRIAISATQDEIMILDPVLGHEPIRLSTLPVLRSWPVGFNPNGGKLVTATNSDAVHVWELQLVRQQLATLGLDWEDSQVELAGENARSGDTVAPAAAPKTKHKPLRLTIDSGETIARTVAKRRRQEADDLSNRATQHQRTGRWRSALAELKKAASLDPTNDLVRNNLAWFLATCPEREWRDIPRAVESARVAVDRAPNDASYRNTLGLCLYRSGDWRAAITELTRAEELFPGKYFAHNAFFLAMSHWQLGDKDVARSWYSQAIEWLDKNKPAPDDELTRFLVEAASLLGIELPESR
jgi:serine/threonine protein kinase/WD40 repeat protein